MTKKIIVSIGVFVLFLTGCASTDLGINDAIQNTKLVTMTPNVPQIRKKYSISEYKNKSFDVVLKNIYANPIKQYSTVYIVDCKTISDDSNLTGANYLCHRVKIGNQWQWRPQWIQDNINKKINKLFIDTKEELNKFCIAKGGYVIANKKFYDKNGKLKDMRNTCIVNNRVYFAYAEKNEWKNRTGLKIWTPEYFNIKNMNPIQKIKRLKSFLLRNNAKQINNNQFDVTNYNGNIFDSIQRFFSGVYTATGFGTGASNLSKSMLYEYYDNFGRFLCKNIDNRLYQAWVKNDGSNQTPLIYFDKNDYPIAILLFKKVNLERDPYILFVLNRKKSIQLKNEFDALKDNKHSNKHQNFQETETINY